eukprot:sb/3466223/
MDAPASDPTHLCPRHRRIIEEKMKKKGEEKVPLKGVIEVVSDELSKGEKKKIPARDTSPVFRSAPLPRPIFETPRVRLSYPIESTRKEKPRPLTPVLTVHSRSSSRRRAVASPTRIDFFKQLPVELTMSLLLDYLSPRDLINNINFQSQENRRTSTGRSTMMCQSRGILSPIQHAAAPSPTLRHWHLSTPPTSSTTSRQSLSVKGRKISPGSSGGSNSSRHPSKRPASIRDVWEDTLPTPEKYKPVKQHSLRDLLSDRGGGSGGISKLRTPLKTIGTPNTLSTCSSKTSLSSTSSFLTPDMTSSSRHWSSVTPTTPVQDRDGFKASTCLAPPTPSGRTVARSNQGENQM